MQPKKSKKPVRSTPRDRTKSEEHVPGTGRTTDDEGGGKRGGPEGGARTNDEEDRKWRTDERPWLMLKYLPTSGS